jgi:hypothetical protein
MISEGFRARCLGLLTWRRSGEPVGYSGWAGQRIYGYDGWRAGKGLTDRQMLKRPVCRRIGWWFTVAATWAHI